MYIGRTIPPAAAPIFLSDIINGLRGIINGQREVDRFIAELKHHFGVKHCILASSGKAALTIILQALHELHPDRDEVLIPAFTCYSVPASIIRAGLKIRLHDTDPETLDFNFSTLQKDFHSADNPENSRLLAVVPTHLFGIPVNIDALRDLISDPQLTIIEDAAQAMGGRVQGKKLGTLGDVGFFSLDRGKAFSTVEGGIILTNNDAIAEKITERVNRLADYSLREQIKLIINALLISFFQHPALFWIPKSLPFLKLGQTLYNPEFKIRKFSSFQAGLARNWEGRLMKFREIRKKNLHKITSVCDKLFNKYCPLSDKIPALIRLPLFIDGEAQRKKILKESSWQGLGIMRTYPSAINEIEELHAFFKEQKYPGAEKLSRTLITLPVHPLITQGDILKIGTIIKTGYAVYSPGMDSR